MDIELTGNKLKAGKLTGRIVDAAQKVVAEKVLHTPQSGVTDGGTQPESCKMDA